MAGDCNKRNPLSRNGSSQLDRLRAALDPEFFGVDERETPDLLLFARRFSEHIQFYDDQNAKDGDWLPFFSSDISVILAGLNRMPVSSFLTFYRGLIQYLEDEEARLPGDLSNHFKLLFHLPVVLLQEVGDFYEQLDWQHPLRGLIDNLVGKDLEVPVERLIAYYKGVLVLDDPPINETQIFSDVSLALADYNTNFNSADSRIQLPSVVTDRIRGTAELSAADVSGDLIASFAPTGWVDFFTSVAPDPNPYLDSAGAPANEIYHQVYDALNYGLLRSTFDRLFQAIERIGIEAGNYFAESLETFDEHTPHYGLWLSFLEMFRVNQDHLNTTTERHLEHYYEGILQLCRKGPEPDQVHLLFELSKNIEDHLLETGTEFKAGKDAVGKEVTYALDNDIVVNRGAVEELKALLQPSAAISGTNFFLPIASPVANSADGNGEDLPKDDKKWKPFGPLDSGPDARIGWAISDRQLFAREGARIFATIFETTSTVPFSIIPFAFNVALTTEEGWFETTDVTKTLAFTFAPNLLMLVVALDGEDPAIIPYDEDLHGEGFSTEDPVMKVELAFGLNPISTFFATLAYAFLKDMTFDSVKLQVYASGLRDLVLRNGFGDLDPSKPFMPFGPRPTAGTPFVIGSSEVFSKGLQSVTLSIEWEQLLNTTDFFKSSSPTSYTATAGHLKEGQWSPLGASSVGLFASSSRYATIILNNLDSLSSSTDQTLANPPFDKTSAAGFIRLKLDSDFGHADYPAAYTLAAIAIANDSTNPSPLTLPKEPYTPKISEFSLAYLTAAASPEKLLHLTPFGYKEASSSSGRFLPELSNEGELYIGVAGLDPPQRLTLLFQTVDGTANPLKGEADVDWAYLKGDVWIDFPDQEVDDKTANLSGSGVVGLNVPTDADTEHNVLPSGLHWFRMSVASDADAVNQLLDIRAQAVTASFLDQANDPTFVETALPPDTISKLRIARSAIKSISQPYASFGGKPEESDDGFYRRVSERLRHKDRASTMWDYEQLVLQEFPKVYKVKCINHTELCRDANNKIIADNELKPGHVLVVTIPYILPDAEINPLRPYTTKTTLVSIDRFLRDRITPFVQLEVQNPKLEEVQVEFEVEFTSDISDISFYSDELRQAIIRFLTPWAYEDGAEISFGGKWHKSAIINFVEEQPYVDFVKDFRMYHKPDIEMSDASWARIDEELIEATTSRSILVSHSTHVISEFV